MKCGVVVFPGSNCDHDLYHVLKHVMGLETRFVWHKEQELSDLDAVFLPGGFSYGDYLRTGAIARFSPVMNEVIRFAQKGGPVLGICNGFQILCESGLLPGALLRNRDLDFICKSVYIRVENTDTIFTGACQPGQVLKMPIAHGDGNFFVDQATLEELESRQQVLFRYCDHSGQVNEAVNPNGSLNNIAGICNRERNVVGMMPHPERAAEAVLGSEDGRFIFQSLVETALNAVS